MLSAEGRKLMAEVSEGFAAIGVVIASSPDEARERMEDVHVYMLQEAYGLAKMVLSGLVPSKTVDKTGLLLEGQAMVTEARARMEKMMKFISTFAPGDLETAIGRYIDAGEHLDMMNIQDVPVDDIPQEDTDEVGD